MAEPSFLTARTVADIKTRQRLKREDMNREPPQTYGFTAPIATPSPPTHTHSPSGTQSSMTSTTDTLSVHFAERSTVSTSRSHA